MNTCIGDHYRPWSELKERRMNLTKAALDGDRIGTEPSTWAMMLLGFAGLGFAGYRRATLAA
jgi:PEP-CTERM motif